MYIYLPAWHVVTLKAAGGRTCSIVQDSLTILIHLLVILSYFTNSHTYTWPWKALEGWNAALLAHGMGWNFIFGQ